ncbi:sulfite exporter TauE/SafE family protein [Thetidibacter halocola]|uniref:Probable membrane transporter protein n=1 Tax=Thetidibacter halocola TaxID=2827239 RepID=A0A8J8B5P4_9RHOB|nr:sulfite exporter TauE/SafE family protein [Thetidibacter halocola]MBS0123151.1 sulfite exporter TauE/SafE family protein [Thetidibacter halocola]
MPDALAQAFSTPGLAWVALAALVAGTVRGFAGFGTAMVFLPVAGQVLSPLAALVALVVMDAAGPVPNLPRAWRDGQPADIARLMLGMTLALPFGLMLLALLDPTQFRIIVSVIALTLVTCLVLGLRYRGRLRPPMVYGIGGVSGILGGVAGIPGPPVILFYMASPLPAAAIRANTMMFLFLFDLVFLSMLGVRGSLNLDMVLLGVTLMAPVVLGNVVGAAIFRPERERAYRIAAYVIITASALSGLPFWH